MTTDCFTQTVTTMTSTHTFFNSFYYYNYDDFLAPVYKLADLGIELTNEMSYCQSVNFAKQLGIRTTTWGGFIEMGMTIIMAFVKNLASKGNSDLYNAFEIAFVSSNSCARSARAGGEMLALILSVETPAETFFEDLTFSLADV